MVSTCSLIRKYFTRHVGNYISEAVGPRELVDHGVEKEM